MGSSSCCAASGFRFVGLRLGRPKLMDAVTGKAEGKARTAGVWAKSEERDPRSMVAATGNMFPILKYSCGLVVETQPLNC